MSILVIGSGSIGKRHIKNLIGIGYNKDDISAVDTREDRIAEVKALGINSTFASFEESIKNKKYEKAIICSPTSMHIDQATKLAELGTHMLIEKPLCSNLDGIENLKKICEEKKLVVMIAYIFRFSPAIKKVKELLDKNSIGEIYFARGEFSEYLPDWHPYEDYRSFYMAEKKLGGGSILDQCHIMDLMHYFFGKFKSVMGFNSKVSNLEVNADDISEMIVEMENGLTLSIHTDIFGRRHRKCIEIKGSNGNIFWDFYDNSVTFFKSDNNIKKIFNNFDYDFNNSYIDEIKHFLHCVENKKEPEVTLQEGIDSMNLILACEKSHKLKKLVII